MKPEQNKKQTRRKQEERFFRRNDVVVPGWQVFTLIIWSTVRGEKTKADW